MKEITNINLVRMNNGAHFQFIKTVSERVNTENEITANAVAKKAVDALTEALAEEDRCLVLSQKSMLTDEISDADRERDQLLSGYRAAVKGFRNISVPAMAEAAKVLWQNLKDYKIDPGMQLERETGLINNLIDDCEKKYATQVDLLSLASYVTALKAANARVENLLVQRTEIKSTQVLGALRLARLQSDAAYRLLAKIVNAMVLLLDESKYAAFIDFVNELIVRYKQQVIPSGKSGKEPEFPPKEEPEA